VTPKSRQDTAESRQQREETREKLAESARREKKQASMRTGCKLPDRRLLLSSGQGGDSREQRAESRY
jgi:hypothetical protein